MSNLFPSICASRPKLASGNYLQTRGEFPILTENAERIPLPLCGFNEAAARKLKWAHLVMVEVEGGSRRSLLLASFRPTMLRGEMPLIGSHKQASLFSAHFLSQPRSERGPDLAQVRIFLEIMSTAELLRGAF